MSDPNPTNRAQLTTEAADWYARLRAETLTEIEAVRFRAWLARDPSHRKEFEALDAFWDDLSSIEHFPEVVRERAAIAAERRSSPPRERGEGPRAAIYWGIAATVLIAIGVFVWTQTSSSGHYTTGVGEQRTISLADGSVVTLNTATELRLHYSPTKRGVELLTGQANFEVAKDAKRPFIVTAGSGEVRAVGTVFDIYKVADQVTVTLIEGKVAVLPRAQPSAGEDVPSLSGKSQNSSPLLVEGERGARKREIFLTAGQQLSYAVEADSIRRADADLPRVLAWRARKLDFDDTPLVDAIVEANRYSRVQIELAAPELRTARISGVFEAGKNELFVEGLQTYFHLKVDRATDDRIILTTPR